MSSDFEYTHTQPVTSSLVDAVWYNSDDSTLAVSLNGEVYVYSNVPYSRYLGLVQSRSVGREYQGIKRAFGPGDYFGWEDDFLTEPKSYEAPDMSPVGAPGIVPKNLTVKDSGTTGSSSGPHISLGGNRNASTATLLRHKVVFTTPAGGEHSHTLFASSVDDAVSRLNDLVRTLRVDVTVTEVTTYFE